VSQLFPIITGQHMREAIQRGRTEKNAIREQIAARVAALKLTPPSPAPMPGHPNAVRVVQPSGR